MRRSDVVLERLSLLHPKIIDLSLSRVERLLELLDHPEKKLPPVIHVAGTNGKGSLLAYLRAILEAGGKTAHVYTSPHLVKFHERIRLAGELISEEELVRLLERCETVNGSDSITFFEVTTVAAFLAFSTVPADALLLETGLGGRLDATNVIDRPALTAITPISIDHTQFLGNTIEAIAGEKAGILKAGVPCVVGKQCKEALAVIEKKARDVGAELYIEGRDWSITVEQEGFLFKGRKGTALYPKPNLLGPHQIENAAMAIACAEILSTQLDLKKEHMASGLTQAIWPGRMQQLHAGALPDLLPDNNWQLWLDGGHNESAGLALASFLQEWQDQPVHIIYGMLNTKAATDYLRPLAPLGDSLRAIEIPFEAASLSAEDAASHAREAGFEASACETVQQAVEEILTQEKPGRILICGSLYLAGHILSQSS
ncbi:bifunctional folylpolyglutamate synthase/dihydrofolate synthase [Kiloniella laminariae]|uniref:Bifunctional folylpolyglutamate synthase/dihydrofolate synthase n=1 Tax=Kiloniella laminariae TaxID=454162 RepID=A0ABT4LN60_9PROT|nr:folylpolyglutamate synthase/dihydrofolate synthase family protein [Kiloniella laminariae]MCZ4281382.1 bifunctional folylpolyglutamate synthase/dihydrofolate synthase [Kiloniella laminariae]